MDRIVDRAEEYLSGMQGRKVLVLGDLMIDQYIWGDVNRVSPEAPVPVVGVHRETLRLGGAANVAHNIVSAGGKVELCGLVGDDQMGRWIVRDLKERGVETRGILLSRQRPTTVKTRVLAHNQQVVRVDREVTTPLNREDEDIILRSVTSFLGDCGALVLSDYAKGVVTPTLVARLVQEAHRAGVPVAVDPKVKHFSLYRGVDVLTPNLLEASAGAGMIIGSMEELEAAGRAIVERLGCRNLVITRGEHGMTLFDAEGRAQHIPAVSRDVFDVTGAGDTVVAVLALGLAAGLSVYVSAWMANLAAGVVVGELGTVPITASQLRDRFRELRAQAS